MSFIVSLKAKINKSPSHKSVTAIQIFAICPKNETTNREGDC
jgi:hypothetical protein